MSHTRNKMPVEIIGELTIPGWDEMMEEQPNKARTLQAMANLEIRAAVYGEEPPKQKTILEEMNRLGADLSPTSVKVVSENIHALIDEGHVVYKMDYQSRKGQEGRGRGGPTSPWRTRYITRYLKRTLSGAANKISKE